MNNPANSHADVEALPDAISNDLAAFGVSGALQGIIAAVSAQRSITSHHVPGDYVSISPGSAGYIASYIHRDRLTIAMPPATAEAVGRQYGWDVEPDSGITSFVKIPADGLATDPHRAAVVDLLVQAIKWRAVGSQPAWPQGAGHSTAAAPVNVCRVHNLEKFGGRCDLCDE